MMLNVNMELVNLIQSNFFLLHNLGVGNLVTASTYLEKAFPKYQKT